jgi:uncharacterized protein with PQ loop repeat
MYKLNKNSIVIKSSMSEYLMNIASILYIICYIPEFYANWENKNANWYNVIEKIVMITACSCALQYSIEINNRAMIINYAPALSLDCIALVMRIYYAYLNRNRNVKVDYNTKINEINIESQEEIVENPLHIFTNDSEL